MIKVDDQKGTALVEFAIVALLFFTLIFGIIEIGFLLFNQQVVTNAGREGARYGIVSRPVINDEPCLYKICKGEIEQKVKDYAEGNIVSFGDKKFSAEASFKSGLTYCEEFKDELTVDVTYRYSFLFLPFVEKSLGTKAIMICE